MGFLPRRLSRFARRPQRLRTRLPSMIPDRRGGRKEEGIRGRPKAAVADGRIRIGVFCSISRLFAYVKRRERGIGGSFGSGLVVGCVDRKGVKRGGDGCWRREAWSRSVGQRAARLGVDLACRLTGNAESQPTFACVNRWRCLILEGRGARPFPADHLAESGYPCTTSTSARPSPVSGARQMAGLLRKTTCARHVAELLPLRERAWFCGWRGLGARMPACRCSRVRPSSCGQARSRS